MIFRRDLGFTLLELLLSVFLSTILLVFIFQVFGQVVKRYSLVSQENDDYIEIILFFNQIRCLKEWPVFENDKLYLKLESSLGFWTVVYDLNEKEYLEMESEKEEEEGLRFRGKGMEKITLFQMKEGRLEELDPASSWPKEGPLLLEAVFLSGLRAKVVLPQ